MVIWGAICGAILGFLLREHDFPESLFFGAVFGAIAGATLRSAIRSEVRAALADKALAPRDSAAPAATRAPVAAHIPPPAPVREDFHDTMPQPEHVAPAMARVPLTADEPAHAAAATGVPPRPAARAPAPREPDVVEALIGKAKAWLFGGNTVVRMGVLVLFVGLAFLAKYAIDNALLPPELRLAAIAAAGIALFVVGFRLRGKAPDKLAYALTLQGAGVAVLYLTVFAAFRLYQFLPAGAAFVALGLVCAFSAVIAVVQNAPAMAFIGFAGGFAAPILVSTGQGSHVGLFSYYLLLGVAIAALAWVKAWRALNLLGFFATFGVATLWGALKYRPENLSSTEPFLIAFFAVYLAASLMYALRHSLAAKRAVDATLIFGNPIVALGLQAALVRDIEYALAFSSLALGALYLALGWWMVGRRREGDDVRRWLAESFLALGLGFVTLAVPLALDARWTSAVWAVEGAAVFWMGRRQERWLARAAGLLLQVLAGFAFLDSHAWDMPRQWPFANPAFIGCAMLALSAFAVAHWSRERASGATPIQKSFAAFEHGLSPLLFWAGFLWLQLALHAEIDRAPQDAGGIGTHVFDAAAQSHLQLLAWVASAFALHFLAAPSRQRPWRVAATPAYTVLPVMVLGALWGVATLDHVFQSGGWITWPIALVLHGVMLRRLDESPPQGWWSAVHAGGVWLLVLLVGNLLVFAVGKGGLWHTAWASVILLVAGVLVLLLLSRRAWFEAAHAGGPWPLGRFGRSYLWIAAAPLALLVAIGCLFVAVYSDGNAKPLPYVPLLNPTDLAIALGLAGCAMWLARIRQSDIALPTAARDTRWVLVLAAIGFVAVNTVWLRIAHHYAGVAWDAGAMFDSFLVQAGYSILWTLIALGLMVGSHRRALRGAWMLGAGLLVFTVAKMFLVDLSNRGGSERIFVFIAVGVLMLVVGYFAPMPPVAGKRDALQGAPS
jgi:uncharacterized membrane protein